MADLTLSPEFVAGRLLSPDAPVLVDLRTPEDAGADPRRMPAAVHLSLAQVEAGEGPVGPCVCSCQKGGKLSQLAAAILRARGVTAYFLPGGHLGWVAAGLPMVALDPPAARWVMPRDPGWEEMATLWVLRRYVDRVARVLPVDRSWMAAAAEAWGAAVLPGTTRALAELAGLDVRFVPDTSGGPTRLLSGRLARVDHPEAALDLVDDWLAGAEVAA